MRRVLVRADRCIGCRSCEIACVQQHLEDDSGKHGHRPAAIPRIRVECGVLDRGKVRNGESDDPGHRGNLRKTFVVVCQNCDEPECVEACISGALTKDADGIVRHHPELCVGCLMCIMACNYGAIYREPNGKAVIKCDLCGGKEPPSCVEACKVDVLYLEPESLGGD